MFRNDYQGGAVVELFSGQGKDPVARWRLSGSPSAVHKEYNKEVKGFVYCLEGSSQTVKMQMPENGRMSLGLIQRFLVLQVNIPQRKDFSIEVAITDSEHLKRRLHLSTVHKELSATLLHAKIPFVGLKRNVWSTLCIDLVSFTGELFKGFLTLDGITLFATCKVRRIFTMKTEPTETSNDDTFLTGAGLMDLIPRSCHFPPDVKYVTQVLNMVNLQKADMRSGPLSSDCGTRGSLQPHPPRDGELDKQRSMKLRVHSSVREGTASSDGVRSDHRNRSKTREKCTPPPSRQQSRNQALTLTDKTKDQTEDEPSCTPAKESSGVAPTPAESLPSSIRLGLSADLQVWGSRESNEGSEPQFTLQDEVFTFSSQPHSPKRGRGQGDQGRMEMGDDRAEIQTERRHDAQPEDDFIGSESDEDQIYTKSSHTTLRSPSPLIAVQLQDQPRADHMDQITLEQLSLATTSLPSPSSGRAELTGLTPICSLSPSTTPRREELKCGQHGSEVVDENHSFSLSRRLLQEVKLDDSTQHEEEDNTLRPVGSNYNLHMLSSPRVQRDDDDGDNDDDELRMLASLKREQKEDECRASGLSASQIHHCNVSISMSSDDASTWAHVSMPANQGHHYQKEMNPLLQSNPREWMDVLSPPIMPPSRLRRSGNTWNDREDLIGGGDESVNEEEKEEDEYLNLLYDPCLNCYFDPKTGKYYELA